MRPRGAVRELKLRRDGVAWRDLFDTVVVLDEHAEVYLATNAAGALLWRLLDGGATRGELVAELCVAGRIDRLRGAADADAFLAVLDARGLLAPPASVEGLTPPSGGAGARQALLPYEPPKISSLVTRHEVASLVDPAGIDEPA